MKRSSTGIVGVYRIGSGYVAEWRDEYGEDRAKRFADKWEAARWREAAIEGRASQHEPTIGDRLSDAAIESRLQEGDLNPRRADEVRRVVRWIRETCGDLLKTPLSDQERRDEALRKIQRARVASDPDRRVAPPLLHLVGTWIVQDGRAIRDGVEVRFHLTTPRRARLIAGASRDGVRKTKTIIQALALLDATTEPLPERILGRSVVQYLERLGIVEVLRDERRTAPDAIKMLLVRDRTEEEIGRGAADTLRAKGYAVEITPEPTRYRAAARVSSLRRALETMIGAVPKIEIERSAPRRTRLAIATGNGDAHADPEALLALDRRIVEMADGDAADRILYLMQVFALRQSEARGIQVRDLADGLLVVQRQRLETGQATKLKTPWSRRRLPIAPDVWLHLERWSAGRAPEEWLIAEPATNNLLQQRRNDRAQEVGFTGRIYSHDHRHIRASLALHHGVQETDLSHAMGHRDTQQVRETYGELMGAVVNAEVFRRK